MVGHLLLLATVSQFRSITINFPLFEYTTLHTCNYSFRKVLILDSTVYELILKDICLNSPSMSSFRCEICLDRAAHTWQ